MTVTSAAILGVVVSPAADRLAALLVKASETAMAGDPDFEYDVLLDVSGLSADDLADAAQDLAEQGLVEVMQLANGRDTPFDRLAAAHALFSVFDGHLSENDPEADARRLAIDLIEKTVPAGVSAAAQQYGWLPRRMNPAVSYLIDQGLVAEDGLLGSHPWRQHDLRPTSKLRRFVEAQA